MFDFSFEQVLHDNEVTVEWHDKVVDSEGVERPSAIPGWSLSWKRGVIYIGPCPEHKAREAAALFVHLWLNGISAQMASQLIVAYAFINSYQEAIDMYEGLINDIEYFTREGLDNVRGCYGRKRLGAR